MNKISLYLCITLIHVIGLDLANANTIPTERVPIEVLDYYAVGLGEQLVFFDGSCTVRHLLNYGEEIITCVKRGSDGEVTRKRFYYDRILGKAVLLTKNTKGYPQLAELISRCYGDISSLRGRILYTLADDIEFLIGQYKGGYVGADLHQWIVEARLSTEERELMLKQIEKHWREPALKIEGNSWSFSYSVVFQDASITRVHLSGTCKPYGILTICSSDESRNHND